MITQDGPCDHFDRESCPFCLGTGINASSLSNEERVANWVTARIGADHMNSAERAMRLFEEAAELLQAEGVGIDLAMKQIEHVYARPAGIAEQEAAGVAVCLLGWCASAGTTFQAIAEKEIERIEKKPLDQIRGRLARKADADLVTVKDGVLPETKKA
jgi:hypothetical protein